MTRQNKKIKKGNGQKKEEKEHEKPTMQMRL
jgi:hypothetical protein